MSSFYEKATAVQQFSKILDPNVSVDVPNDWFVVLTDIRGSTKAVSEGRYRDVNLIGAASLASVINECQPIWIPFVFGGDGATALVPPEKKALVAKRLQALMNFSWKEYRLELRVGIVPVADLLAAGQQLRVVKYELHSNSYIAMLLGKAVPLAESWVKSGKYLLAEDASQELRLNGLSCRWQPIQNQKGLTLTVLATATSNSASSVVLQQILAEISAILGGDLKFANPVHLQGLQDKVTTKNLWRESRMIKSGIAAFAEFIKLRIGLSLLQILIKLKLKPVLKAYGEYKESLGILADYKKFDDALRMVIDCTNEQADKIESLLNHHYQSGECFYGTHRSTHALMTCYILPPKNQNQHIHFIDGSDGGYTLAAKKMKDQINNQKS